MVSNAPRVYAIQLGLIGLLAASTQACSLGESCAITDTGGTALAPEMAFPGQHGELREDFLIRPGDVGSAELPIVFEDFGTAMVFEGDILLHPGQLEGETVDAPGRIGSAALSMSPHWPGGVVPYVVTDGHSNQARIDAAIEAYHQNTSIRLVPRTDETDYVQFVGGTGCSSYVGRIGGRQDIQLADGCSVGAAIHEIGHALGFWHEQSRSDRDQYVEILFDNVHPEFRSNFDTYAERGYPGVDLGPYDFDSVMHYPHWAFSINGQSTILRRDNGQPVANEHLALSAGDRAAIAAIYGDHTASIVPDGQVCGGAGPFVPPPVPAGTTPEQIGLIVRTYCAAFDRVPDPGGFEFWLGQVQGGATIEDLGLQFFRSQEFTNRYGGNVSTQSLVRLLYVLVLDREPDTGGFDHWVGLILGGLDPGHALGQFANSTEYRNRTRAIFDG